MRDDDVRNSGWVTEEVSWVIRVRALEATAPVDSRTKGKKLGTFASRELGEFASFWPFSEPSGTEGCLSGIDVGGS